MPEWLLCCIKIKSHLENVLFPYIICYRKAFGQLQYHLNIFHFFFHKTLNLQLVLYSPSACISVKTTHFLCSINATQRISLQDKSVHLNTYVSINLKNIYIFMSLKQDELLDLIVSHRTRTCGDYDGMHKTAAVIKWSERFCWCLSRNFQCLFMCPSKSVFLELCRLGDHTQGQLL